VDLFLAEFYAHIGRTGSKFRTQGPEIVSSLCAAAFGFGNPDLFLMKSYQLETEERTAQKAATKEPDPQALPTNDFQRKLQNLRSRIPRSQTPTKHLLKPSRFWGRQPRLSHNASETKTSSYTYTFI
jgi:hypothetical protein